jgi:hypothetical protein
MKIFLCRSLKLITLTTISLLFSLGCIAQTPVKPAPDNGLTYSVKPDYRKCAFPACGGWYLTPVNQYSLQLETADDAYQNSLIAPNTIYVAYINYRTLNLTPEQIKELEASLRSGQGLLRGTINSISTTPVIGTKTLVAQAAWTSPTKTDPVGPYLKVSSSGIVCITTPCPYYKAELINTAFTSNFDELVFDKAELDREQTAQAWQAVSSGGLVITGVKYDSKGQVGTGTGISATKVFFDFPPKK